METIWQNKITLDHYQEYKMSMHESTLRKINNIINIWERRYQSPIQKEFIFKDWEERIDREKKALGHSKSRGEKANKEEWKN